MLATAAIIQACSSDSPTPSAPQTAPHILVRSAIDAAPGLVKDAIAGVRRRGEQGEMVKLEVELPGFGGFFRDSVGEVVVYVKASSKLSPAIVRRALHAAYATRPEPAVREAMASAYRARIIDGEFALSELIAIENRISSPPFSMHGYLGVGVSLFLNRVKVGFVDSASMRDGLRVIDQMGVPRDAIVGAVWGKPHFTANWNSVVRPTRGGVQIAGYNRTAVPWLNNIATFTGGSLGFNVRRSSDRHLVTER